MNKDISKNKSDENDDYKVIILCPNCNKTIPWFELVISETNQMCSLIKIFLYFKCSCSDNLILYGLDEYLDLMQNQSNNTLTICSNPGHSKETAVKYCTICQIFLCQECLNAHIESSPSHIIHNKELITSCTIHKQHYVLYCNDCNKDICEQCQTTHSTHDKNKIDHSLISKAEIVLTDVKKYNESIARLKETFIKSLDKKNAMHTEWKGEINDTYNTNKKINGKVEDFCGLLLNTSLLLGKTPISSIIQSIELIQTNQAKVMKFNKTISEKEYDELSRILMDEFPLQIRFMTEDEVKAKRLNESMEVDKAFEEFKKQHQNLTNDNNC